MILFGGIHNLQEELNMKNVSKWRVIKKNSWPVSRVLCLASKVSIIYLSDLPPGLPAYAGKNEQFLIAGIFGLAARKLNGTGCHHPAR